MSTSTAFIGFHNGYEIYGQNEHDPLGKYISGTDTRYHLLEAHDNFLEDQQEELLKLALTARSTNRVFDKAKAWDHFMECATEYWAEAKERDERRARELYETFHLKP